MSPLKSTFGAASAFGWIPRVPVNPTLTNVEYTLWSGGYYVGSPVEKVTGASVTGGISYTVTVGAFGAGTAFSGGSIDKYIAGTNGTLTGNIVNGVFTEYSQYPDWEYYWMYQWYQNFCGWFYFSPTSFFPPINSLLEIQKGWAGAGGNGGAVTQYANHTIQSGAGGAGFAPTSANLTGFPTVVGCGSRGYWGGISAMYGDAYDSNWNYYSGWVYINLGPMGSSGANTGSGGYADLYPGGSGGFTMRYSNTQLPLSSTSGDVVYLNSGGYHNYFWKSTGSFIV